MIVDRFSRAAVAHRTTLVVLAPVLLLLSLVAWGMSSPAGSSPDDDFHLASIWCQTDRAGICEETGDDSVRRLPSDIGASTCYAFAPEQSGACQGDELDSLTGDELVASDRGNFTHLYPPVFYKVMSVLAGDSIAGGVLAMRVLNAFLYIGLLCAVVAAVPAWLRPPAVIGAVVTAVPFGLFLVPSTNPSSWALLSVATFWVSLLGLAFARGRRAVVLGGLALLSAGIGAGARADSLFFLAIAALAVAVLVLRQRGSRWWVYAVALAALVVAAALFSTAEQGGQVSTGLPNDVGSTRTLSDLITLNLLEAPSLWVGMFGRWGLGWLDTLMPAGTWVLASAVFAAVVFWGLSRMGARKLVVVGGAVAALWVIPVVLLVQTKALVGEHVQPRYILPIAVLLAGFAALPVRRGAPRMSLAQVLVVVGGLSLANTLALHAEIRRYVTGTDHLALNLDFAAEWWWDGLPGPNLTWIVGSLAFGAGLLVLAVLWQTQPGRWDLPALVDAEPVATGTGTRVGPDAGEPAPDGPRGETRAASRPVDLA
jgi:hypothetical protein